MSVKDLSFRRTHLPYIWRQVLLLFIGLTAAIVGTIISAHILRTGYNCLLINGDPETDLLDVQFGLHFQIPLLPRDQLPPDGLNWLSPDGRYVAHFEPNTQIAAASLHLIVQRYLTPIPASQQREISVYTQTSINTDISEAS